MSAKLKPEIQDESKELELLPSAEELLIEDIKDLIDKNKDSVALLIVELIESPKGIQTLKALLSIVDDSFLKSVETDLSTQQRITLKQNLAGADSKKLLKSELQHLFNEIKKSLLVAEKSGLGLKKLVAQMKLKDISEFVQRNSEFESALYQMLNPDQLSEYLTFVSTEEMARITNGFGDVKDIDYSQMQTKIEELLGKKNTSPLIQNLKSITELLGPKKETIILNKMLSENKLDELEVLTKHSYPFMLLDKLDEQVRKDFFTSISNELKVQFLLTYHEDETKFEETIALFTSKESKSFELIQMEIDSAKKNENFSIDVDSVQKEFSTTLKLYLRKNEQESVDKTISQWISTLKEANSSSA